MRFILCLLLALVTAPAWAEWLEVVVLDSGDAIYIDPAKIRKNGNFRKVWEIQNLKQRHEMGEMSRRFLNEYDCKEEQVRILSGTSHSEPMAGGKVLLSGDSPRKWIAIAPDTYPERIFKFVCAK